jgi:excisionase family DNA binding protein
MIMAPDKEQAEQVYTIEEVARILKLSEQTVRQLVLNKDLRSKKIGRQYRITQTMLDEYLNK